MILAFSGAKTTALVFALQKSAHLTNTGELLLITPKNAVASANLISVKKVITGMKIHAAACAVQVLPSVIVGSTGIASSVNADALLRTAVMK